MIDFDELKETNDSELIMLYRDNDENAKNLLFFKYKYIIDILINKYMRILKNYNIDMQEVYSECNVGFSDGLKCFNEDKDASLVTFVTLCIERRLRALVRKYSREKQKVIQDSFSLDYIYNDELNNNLMDTLSDNYSNDPLSNMADEEEASEIINIARQNLSSGEVEVFNLMIRGFNYKEIAAILKKTPKQIDNTMQRVKIKMKKLLEKRENF